MSTRDGLNNESLVPMGRSSLAPVLECNPLILRGIAELKQRPGNNEHDEFGVSRELWLASIVLANDLEFIEEWIPFFSDVIRRHPRCAKAFVARGRLWLGKKEYRMALDDFDEGVRLEPTTSHYYSCRAEFFMEMKGYERAIEDFTSAIRFEKVVDEYAGLEAWRGKAKRALGHFDEAVKDFDEVIRRCPTPEGYCDRAEALFAKGDHAQAIEDFKEVIEIYEEKLRLDPNWENDCCAGLAWLLATCPVDSIRNGRRAVELATRLCELESWKGNCLGVLAAGFAEVGHFEEAERYESLYKSERNGPSERLKLYKEHKAYRGCTCRIW
jgi:tetratricopeptide (TPR) repeat protein